jgi:5-methyltetrahydrofolate--homocysteine methyltransferase
VTTSPTLEELRAALLSLDESEALRLTQAGLDEGIEPRCIIDEGLTPGMTEVGTRFESNDFFLPELLVAADIFTKALELLTPHLKRDVDGNKGVVVLGTVAGDIHEIGKNVVRLMLEVAGYEVHDLGIDVPTQAFLDAQRETGATVIGASALLTSTMPRLQELVEAVRGAGLEADVIIGGAPLRERHVEQYGADGTASDAIGAVRLVTELLEKRFDTSRTD